MHRRRFTLLLASVFLLLHPAMASAQQIRLSGSLSDEGEVGIGILRVMLEAAGRRMEMQSLPAQDFEVTLQSARPVLVLMRTESRRFNPFWLQPGADVKVESLNEGDQALIRVTGQGSAGPALLLTGGYEETWKARLEEASARSGAGPSAASIAQYLDDAEEVGLEMDAFVQDAGLSPMYEQILLAENVARVNRIRSWALDNLEPSPEMAATIRSRNLDALMARSDSPGAAHAIRYVEALGDELDRVYRETVMAVSGTTSPSGFYHFRRAATSSPELKDVLALEIMASMLRSDDYTREMSELVEDFARTTSSEESRAFIEWAAAQREQLAPGRAAPALVAEHVDGGQLDLEELRGRTVLLTVWGSWCYWSRQELPHLEELRARMAESDPDVVFVNLGWDQDGPWRDAIEEFGLGGENVLSTEEIRSSWDVTGTPDFIVIAPDGTIVTTDAPRPSQDGGDVLAAVLRGVQQGGTDGRD